MKEFRDELQDLINRHSMENGSDTPDDVLAVYLTTCLRAFDDAVKTRDWFYGVDHNITEDVIEHTASAEEAT